MTLLGCKIIGLNNQNLFYTPIKKLTVIPQIIKFLFFNKKTDTI